jgi:hypothetical protein
MILHADIFPVVAVKPCPVYGKGKAFDQDQMVGILFSYGFVKII